MGKSQNTISNVATTQTSQIYPESHLTPEDTPNFPMGEMSTEVKLPDNQAEQELKAGVGLQRGDADTPLGEDVQQLDGYLSAEQIVLFKKEFPAFKEQREAIIREYRAFADDIDKTHKNFIKTNVVTSSVAVVSGMASILGLLLAPATAGGSLVLSTAGQGLGTVAGAASLVTNLLEYFHNKKVQAQASKELSTVSHKVEDPAKDISHLVSAGKTIYVCRRAITDIKKNSSALKIARAHPSLAKAAKRFVATGQLPANRIEQVQKAFGGTPLALGRKARLVGGVTGGLFLSMDVHSLLKDWKELKDGARTELAQDLRAEAEELERELEELTLLYESLQQEERSLGSSSSEEAKVTLPQPPAKQGEAGPLVTAMGG